MPYPHPREMLVRRVLSHLARTTIAEFPLGPGATVGRIHDVPRPIANPLDGSPCAGYTVAVSWLSGERWIPLLFEIACTGFAMRDATGVARVQAETADVALALTRTHYAGSPADLPPGAQALLARHGHRYQVRVPLLFDEYVLHLGDEVAVCGGGSREPAPGGSTTGYRSQPETRLVIGPDPRFPLALSNLPYIVKAPGGDIPPQRI